MVRRLADANTFMSKTPNQLKTLKKDLTRYLSLGRPRTRGGAESVPYAEAQLASFRQQLAALEAALKAKEEQSDFVHPVPADPGSAASAHHVPVERAGHHLPVEEEVRSMQQKRDIASAESQLLVGSAFSGTSSVYTAKLGSMEVTDEEVSEGTEEDTLVDEQPSVKRSKPTRVPIFGSNPQALQEMVANLRRNEQDILQKIDIWTTKKLSDDEANRSSAWSEKQLAAAEVTLKKVRKALKNVGIEKELIAASNEASSAAAAAI